MNLQRFTLLASLVLGLAAPQIARADKGPPPHARDGKPNASAAANAQASAQAGAQAGAQANGQASGPASAPPSATPTGPSPNASPSAQANGKRRELTDEQKKKRAEHVAEARSQWGDSTLKKPAVREEMRKHLSRLAKLRRIAKVAAEAKKESIEKRAKAAIDKEKARHAKAMEALKDGAMPVPSASATAKGVKP
jgi:hypothetical protein